MSRQTLRTASPAMSMGQVLSSKCWLSPACMFERTDGGCGCGCALLQALACDVRLFQKEVFTRLVLPKNSASQNAMPYPLTLSARPPNLPCRPQTCGVSCVGRLIAFWSNQELQIAMHVHSHLGAVQRLHPSRLYSASARDKGTTF